MKHLIFLMLISTAAYADCAYDTVCDGTTCSIQYLCSGSSDLPTPNVRPLGTLELSPIVPPAAPMIPPIRTTICVPTMIRGQLTEVCR